MVKNNFTFSKKAKIITIIILAVIVASISIVTAIIVSKNKFKKEWWYDGQFTITFTVPECRVETEDGRMIQVYKQTASAVVFTNESEPAERVATIQWCPPRAFKKIEVEIKVDGKILYKGRPYEGNYVEQPRKFVRAGGCDHYSGEALDIKYRIYYEENFEDWQYFRELILRINNYSDNKNAV